MPRFALCVALLCALVQSASALQLGENRDELVAKHGAPSAEDRARNMAAYFWDGWSAQVEFQENTVGKLTYRRNWYLGESEIKALLQSNGGTRQWREVPNAYSQSRKWVRDDGAIANCLRARPLSMIFETAAFAASEPPEPKVVTPATSNPAPAKAPTYPKMLGTNVEPELPVGDPPILQDPADRPLPKLPATEVNTTTTAATSSSGATPAAPAEAAPEPKRQKRLAPLAPPSTEISPAAETPGSHALEYGILAAALIAAMAGGGVYFHKRRVPPLETRPISFSTPIPAFEKSARRIEPSAEMLASVSGVSGLRLDQFEMLIGEIFRRQEYTVEMSAALSADEKIDVTLRRDSETILVQCHYWKMSRVTERELREFYTAMTDCGAPRGVFVTTGEFTANAQSFADGRGIELMDGAAIAECIEAASRPGENMLHVEEWMDEFVANSRIFDPECPVCHGTMLVRHNRTTGSASWCCRTYPRCPGRREPRQDLLPTAAAH